MPGPQPRPAGNRRRRNISQPSTAVVLAPLSSEEVATPEVLDAKLMPRADGQPWHPAAEALWDAIVASPQSRQLVGADWHMVATQLIDLVHDYHSIDIYVRWTAQEAVEGLCREDQVGEIIINPKTKQPYTDRQQRAIKLRTSTEIRFWSAKFGLTPLDRYMLKWQIAEAQSSEERVRRWASRPPSSQTNG